MQRTPKCRRFRLHPLVQRSGLQKENMGLGETRKGKKKANRALDYEIEKVNADRKTRDTSTRLRRRGKGERAKYIL